MYRFLAIIGLLLSCYLQLRALRLRGAAEVFLASFGLASAHIVVWGLVLSAWNRLGDVQSWGMLASLWAALTFAVTALLRRFAPSAAPREAPSRAWIRDSLKALLAQTSHYERWLLTPLVLTVVVIGLLNLAVVLFTAPGTWDSMTYHLARVAYYLQHGNANSFDANYWAQVVHPKNSAFLLAFVYLVSGRNENLMQLVQFAAYWVAVCSIYVISRQLGNRWTGSLLAACVGALFVEWLMQATTTQNDLLLTAYIGAVCCFLLAFRETHARKYLALSAVNTALAIGTKASSALALPSVALIALYVLFRPLGAIRMQLRDLGVLALTMLLAIAILALPSGYLENYQTYGNPVGPSSVRELVAFEGDSLPYILENGTKNFIRYGYDFLSLDGLPPVNGVRQAQAFLRSLPARVVPGLLGWIEVSGATRSPFQPDKVPTAHEDLSYWGIFGLGLVWITVLLSIVGLIKSADLRLFALASVLFFLAQAYSGPYDPWRGRYFCICGIFAAPTVGALMQPRSRLAPRLFLGLMVVLGCISALAAVAFRSDGALLAMNTDVIHTTSIFTEDRITQLTRNAAYLEDPLRKFSRLVPESAAVAVAFPGDTYEYPWFGAHLTRTLLPINSFEKGLQPIPPTADYLLYSAAGISCSLPHDIYLGKDLFLRKLTGVNRYCP